MNNISINSLDGEFRADKISTPSRPYPVAGLVFAMVFTACVVLSVGIQARRREKEEAKFRSLTLDRDTKLNISRKDCCNFIKLIQMTMFLCVSHYSMTPRRDSTSILIKNARFN